MEDVTPSPDYSSDEMDVVSDDNALAKDVGRKMNAMRVQLNNMNNDRNRVLDEILRVPAYGGSRSSMIGSYH